MMRYVLVALAAAPLAMAENKPQPAALEAAPKAITGWTSILSAQQLHERLGEQKVVLIDARKPELYAKGHLPGAINLPGDTLRTPSAKPGKGDSQYIFRQQDGSLKALHNTCRHRATQLCKGQGRLAGGQIVCPFHGWRFEDGRCVGIPYTDKIPPTAAGSSIASGANLRICASQRTSSTRRVSARKTAGLHAASTRSSWRRRTSTPTAPGLRPPVAGQRPLERLAQVVRVGLQRMDAARQPARGAVGNDYVIGPEDVLQITVWKNDTLSRVVPVRPDGKISMPLLHDVQEDCGVPNAELKKRFGPDVARQVHHQAREGGDPDVVQGPTHTPRKPLPPHARTQD